MVAFGRRMSTGGAPFRNPHNLPVKDCVVCGRPFTWRKKWEKCWNEVLTCSNRCKTERKKSKGAGSKAAGAAAAGLAAGVARRGRKAACSESDDDGSNDAEDLGVEGRDGTEAGSKGASRRESVAEVEEEQATAELAEEAAEEHLPEEGEDLAVLASQIRGASLEDGSEDEDPVEAPVLNDREARKARRQALKAERKARRAMSPEEKAREKRKPCDICGKPVNLLVRCTCDSTQKWRMLCGRCWNDASGGVPDGDAEHPYYRYGGLWKNRSAKITTPSFSGKVQAKDIVASADAEEVIGDQPLGA